MALSRIGREFAAEIANHDWSDSPYRMDRAGHKRDFDGPSRRSQEVLDESEAARVRVNVMWVTAQVLMHSDPNFDLVEYAEACGVPRRIYRNSDGRVSGVLTGGIRFGLDGRALLALNEGED